MASNLGHPRILRDYGIDLLDSQQALRDATELHNIAYAINGYGGIHSIAYAKEVHKRLLEASESGGRDAVVDALKKMREALERGEVFWK